MRCSNCRMFRPGFLGFGCYANISSVHPLKTMSVDKALVTWYSQTGYTEMHGRLIAKTLEAEGVAVISSKLRDVDLKTVND